MNKQQALQTDQQIKVYLQKNHLRSLFSELTKEVLLKRPADPISHLIDYISKRNKRQIVCIQGYNDEARTKISTNVSLKFNYHHINLSAIYKNQDYHFLNDTVLNSKIIEEVRKVDPIFKGIIISGYPNNAVQCDFIHKCEILPDRYFIMKHNQQAIRAQYLKHFDEASASLLLERNRLENKELNQWLGDQSDYLPEDIEHAIQKINHTLNIKAKKIVPYDAPRIVALHPPFLIPQSLNALDLFSLKKISLESSFVKLSQKQAFQTYVASHIRKTKSLSKEIELALIETQCKSAAAKNKGILLAGWPSKKQSLPFLKEHFLNPNIIFAFNCLKQKALQEFGKLDPQDARIFTITEKPSPEEYAKLFQEYEKVVEELKNQSNVQVLPLSQSQAQVLKTFESLIDNPKIYS